MLTINELAIKANAPAHVVRYYTRIGLIEAATQQENGYRLFSPSAAARLGFIRRAKQLGFTLKEIGEITQHAEHGESPCKQVRHAIQGHIEENRNKILELQNLQARMKLALAQWESMPDGLPDGNSVCPLIEWFDLEQQA